MVIAGILCGPSEVLQFPLKFWITCVGVAFVGAGAAMTVIPVIPEMLEAVEGKYRNQAAVKDTASGIFNMANGFG